MSVECSYQVFCDDCEAQTGGVGIICLDEQSALQDALYYGNPRHISWQGETLDLCSNCARNRTSADGSEVYLGPLDEHGNVPVEAVLK